MIKKLSSREVYSNKWMRVREDGVEFPNGHKGIYGVVEKVPCAMIVPYFEGKLILVKQYRYPVEQDLWEFPVGMHEDEADVDPTELAAEELEEEIGYKAGRLEKLGQIYIAVGFCTQLAHLYVAQDLVKTEQNLEDTESDLVVASFSVEEVGRMIAQGEIVDSPTIAAYQLFSLWAERDC